MCYLADGPGRAAGLTFEELDESVQKGSNFEVPMNCNSVESLDPLKYNRYEVVPCRTSSYRSFQLTVRL